MKRFYQSAVSMAVCLFGLASTNQAHAESYLIDESHTSIIFGISHFNYSYTYGRFSLGKGSNFVWNNANPSSSQFQLIIPTASIDTNDQKRDGHLRGADFFNANQFPQIVFQSTAVKPSGENNYDVVGNLTMHGVTKQVTLPVRKLGEGTGPYGKYRCGFFCQTTINRSDFGMNKMIPDIGNQVAITISFEGIRQGGAGSGSAPAGSAIAAPSGSGSAAKPATGSGLAPKGSGSAPKAGSSGTR